jgi:hypothetical protein
MISSKHRDQFLAFEKGNYNQPYTGNLPGPHSSNEAKASPPFSPEFFGIM